MNTECRQNILGKICQVEKFAAAADLCSSPVTEPYYSFTIHFINSDWNLCSRWTHWRNNGQRIEELSERGLDEDYLMCMTTDSESNIIWALQINRWTRLSHFGHKLHNSIGNWLLKFSCLVFVLKGVQKCQCHNMNIINICEYNKVLD